MNGITRAWNAWTKFWFAKADPTTLGFIRILTGLVLVYTHLVYSFDLYGFFGPNAWYSLEAINRERKEYPHIVTPINSWEEMVPSVRVPSQPHIRGPVLAWMDFVPADATRKQNVLEFLRVLEQLNDYDASRATFTYLTFLRSDPSARKTQLDALVSESVRSPLEQIPLAIKNLPEKGEKSRTSIRVMIEAFYDSLPKADDDRKYLLNYLIELDSLGRAELVKFLERLPADQEKRKAEIEYLGYWGFDRGKTVRQGQPIYSMWFHLTGKTEMAVAHVLSIVVMVLFTLGLWTRVTSVLTWFVAINYIHRTQYVLFGMDTMSNILLIYLMIGDCGSALSLDRLFARSRAVRASLNRGGSIDAETQAFLAAPPPTMSAGLGLRLIQVHFCFIYMAAGLSKLKGASWWGHQAYWDTSANPEFTMIYFVWYENAMRLLVENRFIYSIIAAIAVAHTFVAEIGLPFMVWTRARPWFVLLGILLHAGIAIFMGLTVFSLLMMLLLLSYVPGYAIRKKLFSESSDTQRVVMYDPNNNAHVDVAARAVAIDTEASVELKPIPGTPNVKLTVDGVDSPDVAKDIMRSSMVFSTLAWIPGASLIAGRWLKS